MKSTIMDKLELRKRQVEAVGRLFKAIHPATNYMAFITQIIPTYKRPSQKKKMYNFVNLLNNDERVLKDVEYVNDQLENPNHATGN